jgi:hypothetical protein
MDDKRISRRELLRNLGLAGAAAWVGPVLTSVRASASIDRCRKRRAHRLCKGVPCGDCTNDFPRCGTCSSDLGDGSYCFVRFGDLQCFCAEDVFCSEAGQCTSDADCKAQGLGNICITQNGCTGCGTSTGACSTRCCNPVSGSTPVSKPRRLGRTAAGR